MQRKFVFDVVRRMLGRGFRRAEIAALDAAIEQAMAPPPGDGATLRIGAAGIALIKRFEGCARRRGDGLIEAYPDPGTGGAPWTIGWGATGPGIGPETVWTQARCDARLAADLARYSDEVADALSGTPTSQHQFDALVSFHYNTGAIGRATLTRLHRAGDYAAAAAQFPRWNRAGHKVMAGLSRRRAAEAALYRGDEETTALA